MNILKTKFLCIQDHETKHKTFHTGDKIDAVFINDNWWIADSVGISDEVMNEKFKQIEDHAC